MKVSSREPKSCNIACFTASLVVNGPGVNRSLSLVLMRQFGPRLQNTTLKFMQPTARCTRIFSVSVPSPSRRRGSFGARIIAEGSKRVEDGFDERLLSRFSVLAVLHVYISTVPRTKCRPAAGNETRNR